MEGTRTETVLLKQPEDRETLELVQIERTDPSARSYDCTAPLGYRCPYLRYRTSDRRAGSVELVLTDIVPRGKGEDGELMELVDLDCMYPDARHSECTAPPSFRCAYRQFKSILPARGEMLSQSESGLSHSQPLRLTPNGNRPGSGRRTEDLRPPTYSQNFSQPTEL